MPDEPADESYDSGRCALCHCGVGWVDIAGGQLRDWVEVYLVELDGDDEPTAFCEDCWDWLDSAARLAGWGSDTTRMAIVEYEA